MPRCRVVTPRTVRIDLSEGDWIDVIEELNAGEYLDWLEALNDRKPFAKLLAYVVGWSLIGLDGQPLPYSPEVPEDDRRAAIRSLDKATLRELLAAINKHEVADEARVEAKKKTSTTAAESSATLLSAAP